MSLIYVFAACLLSSIGCVSKKQHTKITTCKKNNIQNKQHTKKNNIQKKQHTNKTTHKKNNTQKKQHTKYNLEKLQKKSFKHNLAYIQTVSLQKVSEQAVSNKK